MANVSLTRVNQKLSQVKVLLAMNHELSPVQLQAIVEAAAFHLVCAYQHYLRELAEVYGLKNTLAVRSEVDLITAFEAAKKYPAEAEELVSLKRSSSSWLSQLHDYYDSLWSLPRIMESQPTENLIPVVDVDQSSSAKPVDPATIAQWQVAFVDLVVRQRATSAEF